MNWKNFCSFAYNGIVNWVKLSLLLILSACASSGNQRTYPPRQHVWSVAPIYQHIPKDGIIGTVFGGYQIYSWEWKKCRVSSHFHHWQGVSKNGKARAMSVAISDWNWLAKWEYGNQWSWGNSRNQRVKCEQNDDGTFICRISANPCRPLVAGK